MYELEKRNETRYRDLETFGCRDGWLLRLAYLMLGAILIRQPEDNGS